MVVFEMLLEELRKYQGRNPRLACFDADGLFPPRFRRVVEAAPGLNR